jgi:hypothetical protein
MYSVENLKLYIEMAHGKQASDKLFNEISWLIVHSLKEHSQHPLFSIRRPDMVSPDFRKYWKWQTSFMCYCTLKIPAEMRRAVFSHRQLYR